MEYSIQNLPKQGTGLLTGYGSVIRACGFPAYTQVVPTPTAAILGYSQLHLSVDAPTPTPQGGSRGGIMHVASNNKNCVPILECVQGKEVGKRLGIPRHHSHTSAQSVYESLGQTEKCTEQSHSQVTSLTLPEHLSIAPFKPRNLCSDSDKWNYSWGRKMFRML